MSAARISAAARVQRLLAILQWSADRPEGVPIDDLCARFHLSNDALVKELDLATMIGADSLHYDEMPFEVFVEDGRVFVRLFSFDRPLRLTPAEGLALVAAADALLGPDGDPTSPLARALGKLAGLLGIEPGEEVDVDLDPDGGPAGRLLAEAVADRQQVRFTYWSYGRDVVEARVVDPWRVFAHEGSWYLAGRSVEADAERRFRLDRMEALEILDQPATAAPSGLVAEVGVGGDAPEVVLDLPAEARWVADAYPVVAVEPGVDGRLTVTLSVAGSSWLQRLLLRVGPDARVVAIDPSLGDERVLATAAARVLARYRDRAIGREH